MHVEPLGKMDGSSTSRMRTPMCMHAHVHAGAYACSDAKCACMRTSAFVCACVLACARVFVHSPVCAHVRTAFEWATVMSVFACTCQWPSVCTRAFVCVRACMRACLRAACACVHVCARALDLMHALVSALLYVHIYMYV